MRRQKTTIISSHKKNLKVKKARMVRKRMKEKKKSQKTTQIHRLRMTI